MAHTGSTRWSKSGVERRADEPRERIGYSRPLDEELPDDFLEALDFVVADLSFAVGSWHRDLKGAQGMIVNHAANDALLLVGEVKMGAGRSAARTARALFEHLVHYCEVTQSGAAGSEAAERYEEHVYVTADQVGRRAIGLARLRGKSARGEKRRLERQLRGHERGFQRVVAAYGKGFKKGWSSRNLFDMATAHGYSDDYDSYRILSAVTHGSAGGLVGTRRGMGADGICHRLGPDLQLVPAAFHEGLTWWRELVKRLPPVPGPNSLPLAMADHVEELLGCYPSLLEATRRLDGLLWPTAPSPNVTVPVLAVFQNGTHAWYELDTRDDVVRRADLVGAQPANMADLLRRGRVETAQHSSTRDRPWTTPVSDVQVQARSSLAPVPSGQLLWNQEVVAEYEGATCQGL